MTILLNGTAHELGTAATLADLVATLTARQTGVAVAVNDEVVPRAAWPTTRLRPGDHVEVLTAVQGG